MREMGHTVHHLRDEYPAGTKDHVWLDSLHSQGGWVVLTADKGIRRKPNEREHWLRKNLIVFFLLPAWSKMKLYERNLRLFRVVANMEKHAVARNNGRGFIVRIHCAIERL